MTDTPEAAAAAGEAGEAPAGRGRSIAGYRLLLAVLVITLVADQASKLWIVQHPDLPAQTYWNPAVPAALQSGGFEIIPGFLYICHVVNTGAAWGMLDGWSGGIILLSLLAFAALVAIYVFRYELALHLTHMQLAFGLLCGGIIGNLIDRVARGHVVDFIDVHLPGYRWPAFNVADSGICVGVGIYLAHSVLEVIREKRSSSPSEGGGESESESESEREGESESARVPLGK